MSGLGRYRVSGEVRKRGRRIAAGLALTAASLVCAIGVAPQIAQAAPAHGTATSVSDRTSAAQPSYAGPVARTPYMGWSSWSLESTNYPGVNPTGSASWLTEQHVLQQADVMAAKLKQYGYDYVNIDAGWTNGTSNFDSYGRPIANPTTFPDGIAYIARYVHAKGLKLGVYQAVGLWPGAYNGGNTPIYGAPGCYTRDIVYPDLRLTSGWNITYKINYASPCAQAYINSIANEFASWGVDFLKLDGVGPGSFQGDANHDNTTDVAAWSAALKATGRPITFVLSWSLSHNEASTWEQNSNGWRIDTDVECYCNTLVTWNNSVKVRWNDVVQWIPAAGNGHWNNLDSLDVGNGAMDGLTDAERQSYMTLWAIEAAPLYSGDDLTQLDSYGLSLLTNREVIAVDQAGIAAKPVRQRTNQQVWYARNSDGSYTVALFNLDATPANVTANWSDLGITGSASVRDLWSHTDLGNSTGSFGASLPAHGSRLLRITPHNIPANNPSVPVNLHGTASTASSISLAWDPSQDHGHAAAGYTVSVNGKAVMSATQPSATLTGLAPATTYQFTVTASGLGRSKSAPSQTLSLTTPAASGPTAYEAESSANTLGGSAGVFGCTSCSGGEKVGYLGGGSGTLTITGVTAPVAGTYLMQLSYVDGDSSRAGVITVNGTSSFDLPLPGTNDNNWDTPQTVIVPVQLNAGNNTIEFSNPTDYVYDIDKIAV